MKQLTTIIFDLDGVIIDTEPLHARTKRMAFDHYGVSVPENLYAEFKGRSDEDMVRYVVEHYGAASLEWKDVLARKHELFSEHAGEIEVVPGALEFIAAARGHFDKLALVTSAIRRNQEYASRRFGLSSFFDVIVTGEDITRTKPDPEGYLAALSRLGVSPESCLVLEDSINGVASANAAGCAVVAITTSFTAEELAEANPQSIVSSYEELASLLGMEPG
jgi:beta-phosphoglucomutase